jgi:hypothetical protein
MKLHHGPLSLPVAVGDALGRLDFRILQLEWHEGRGRLARRREAFAAHPSMSSATAKAP